MNSVDTNVILRFLLNDVPAQTTKAKQILSSPPVYVSDVVFTEAVFVLENSLGYDRRSVVSLLRVLLTVPGLVYSDHLLSDVLTMYENKRSLSFVDCYASTEAGKFGVKLFTFDKKLQNQGGAHVSEPYQS
ncbi:MAG TPA: PIN domain-containing protein [Pyrinomonadaceae bacterium]|nr:PIN domain-containing protein [Pyrinomonadaceae bacterium]